MAKWKPTFYRTNGKPGATAPMRKLARKFLENMKHRNEELGNYANPVQRIRIDDNKFMFSSLPGYDIIDITVPSAEGEYEPEKPTEIYSGCWEPRFHISGLFGWFMRWFPSAYEIYNSETDTDPPGLGASVDGAIEELTAPMPPSRWLYSDYDNTRMETPWFDDIGGEVTTRHTHPGKYSGKLRELAQLQLGYGLLPQFGYTASDSCGIFLEELDEDTTRIWLIQISGANGIVKQFLSDYSIEGFEIRQKLGTGGIPPEIEEAGWFDTQTSFDITRPVYTKAAYDAIPEAERPALSGVTFELLSASAYSAVTGGYAAYGDYGWSFNPDGDSAVLVGLAWNTPGGGGLALNYKSNLFTVTINHSAYTATVAEGGASPFLMAGPDDHVKFPDSAGILSSTYFWKGQNGSAGTQPSSSYTAPIYAYYNLDGQKVQCDYLWNAGSWDTQNGGLSNVLNWAETAACRQLTTHGIRVGTGNSHYAECSTGQSGTGTMGRSHGFTTSITAPYAYDEFLGYRATWSSPQPLCDGNDFIESWFQTIRYGGTIRRAAATHADTHYCKREYGNWNATPKSVLIIPSFERLGFYHYKSLQTKQTGGQLIYQHKFIYERGAPMREHGDGTIGQDDCETGNSCAPPGEFGFIGHRRPDIDSNPEYLGQRTGTSDEVQPIHIACSKDDAHDCFVDDGELVVNPTPADEDPYSSDVTEVVGGLMLPDGDLVMFSEDEINNQSKPFRESSPTFGEQSVISCFDTFSAKYIYSMPNVALTARKHTATGFPDDFTEIGVLFSGMPYFIE